MVDILVDRSVELGYGGSSDANHSKSRSVKTPGAEIIPAIPTSESPVPAIIAAAGDKASEHFLEFFAATIRNKIRTRPICRSSRSSACGAMSTD